MTARHDSVRQALTAAGTFVSAQDLYARLRAAGHAIGLTTVYRALAAMAEGGEADVLSADGQQVYRACGKGEHHHPLVCRLLLEKKTRMGQSQCKKISTLPFCN